MATDSSQIGYLAPASALSLEDEALAEFLQGIVVGITALAGNLVFQRWQPEPPNYPDFGSDWAAVGDTARTRDTFASVTHNGTGDVVKRNEKLDVLVSFYGPNARQNAEKLAMGLQVAQNREAMEAQGYKLIEVLDPVITSDLQNERWVPRIDQPFKLVRGVTFTYPVLDLLGSQTELVPSSGTPITITLGD
jgi:hypothetical protein